MKRLLFAFLLLAGCAKPEAPPPAPPTPVQDTDAAERLSLLDLAHGATVVSRSGEALLDVSALRAVDGEPGSFWTNPPHDLPQSMTVALPARSRIDKVGLRTAGKGGFTAKHVSFEGSDDGHTFHEIATIASAVTGEPQWFPVTPVEASYVRVTMVDSVVPTNDVRLHSVLAAGQELEPPHAGDLAGCWSVNGRPARFQKNGSRVTGIMQMGAEPIRFDGGFDGRIYRLGWIRGNDYGYALLTAAPGNQKMSGIEWHEEAVPLFFGDSWFGDKGQCGRAAMPSGDTMEALLRRVGRFSLFGLEFRKDGSLDAEASKPLLQEIVRFLARWHGSVRFVGHEFRQADPKANHDFAQRELDALRHELEMFGANVRPVQFVTAGSDSPRQDPVTESMRALYSSIDLEIR